MSKLNLTHAEIDALKGAALADAAKVADIPGRSKLKADEIRAALKEYVDAVAESDASPDAVDLVAEINYAPPTPVAVTAEEIDALDDSDEPTADEAEPVWVLVPNRADKRRVRFAKRVRKSRTPFESYVRHVDSVKAGEKGANYGNRDRQGYTTQAGREIPGRQALRIDTPVTVPA